MTDRRGHFLIRITGSTDTEVANAVGSFLKDGERGWLSLTTRAEEALSFGNRPAAERYWQRKRARIRKQFSVEIVDW